MSEDYQFCGLCLRWDPVHELCDVNGLPAKEFDDACRWFKDHEEDDE